MATNDEQSTLPAAAESARTNWAGSYTYRAKHLVQPASCDELQRVLPQLAECKAVGSRHSFNHIADSEDTQVALTRLKAMSLDSANSAVTVEAGVTYGELAPFLEARGFALHNLASLPHISVAGACATGTHGSGIGNGCLTSAVIAMEIMRADGGKIRLTRDQNPEAFRMAAVHLGALGVVTNLTLEVMPTYQVAQTVYENLSFDQLEHNFRAIFSSAYSVSLFTDWQGNRVTQAWLKHKLGGAQNTAAPDVFFGATKQTRKLHPLPNLSAESCTEQEGIPGAWYERLPHFRLDYTPSAGAEIQTEYFVPFEGGYPAIRAIEALRDEITPHLLISELRVVAADDLPMSMCFRRESLGIHFTWKPEIDAVRALLPRVEGRLAPFGARPHWAKLFTMSPRQVRTLYPGFADFERLVHGFDPAGTFRNSFLEDLLRT